MPERGRAVETRDRPLPRRFVAGRRSS